MSSALIMGILLGLAVGGPLYYAYLIFSKKRKHQARINSVEKLHEEPAQHLEDTMNEEPGEQEEPEGQEKKAHE